MNYENWRETVYGSESTVQANAAARATILLPAEGSYIYMCVRSAQAR